MLDKYQILQAIGHGSYGTIRLIKRKSDGKLLVLKEIPYYSLNDRERQQVVHEVNILSNLRHEYIVGYHERFVDRERKVIYLVMEYCAGGDLSKLISDARRKR